MRDWIQVPGPVRQTASRTFSLCRNSTDSLFGLVYAAQSECRCSPLHVLAFSYSDRSEGTMIHHA